jgi:two-component system response regulator AtoC
VGSAEDRIGAQHPGTRYLLIRGKSTALRYILPPFGTITIGRSTKNDICVDEPGVADEHLVIHADFGVGARAVDADSEIDSGGKVAALRTDRATDIDLSDRIRIGSVELTFATHEATKRHHRIWAPSYFERRLEEETWKEDEPSLTVIRFAIEGLSDDAASSALFEHLAPGQIVTELGPGDYGLLAMGLSEEPAQALAAKISKAVADRGGELAYGTAVPADGDAEALLEIAERRIKRAAASTGARIVMESAAMQAIARTVDQVAQTSSHVLIVGETGTGKDVVAQMIHDRSDRAGRPFVRVNCVELGDSSIEDFAREDEEPVLSRVQGGTLVLDEIGGLSQRAQLNLGHVLEKWSAASHATRRQAVRLIATSNQDLDRAVEGGELRKDLYFRLNRVLIEVPPLRKHPEDIAPLARAFLERADGPRLLDESAIAALATYAWPGNVRELKNVIERAAMMSKGRDRISVADLPDSIQRSEGYRTVPRPEFSRPPPEPSRPPPAEPTQPSAAPSTGQLTLREEMAELERRRIIEALEKYPTQTDAAKALDIPLRTFLNRLDALGIPRARKGKKDE